MVKKRITDVDYISSLNNNESFFVNQNNTIKQVNKGNIVFDISNGGTGANNASDARENLGLGSVATEDVLPVSKGGTGATNADGVLAKLGITATSTELNYCDGVTSNIQTQLNGKADGEHTHDVEDVNGFYDKLYDATVSRKAKTFLAAPSNSDGVGEFREIVSDDLPIIPVEKMPTVPVENGGTGSTDGATGLKNLFAAGATVLSSNQYGDELPTSATAGTIFFKKISG